MMKIMYRKKIRGRGGRRKYERLITENREREEMIKFMIPQTKREKLRL